MSRLPVQPTKTNLLVLQEELEFAETGHQLLEEKREILLMKMRELIEELHRTRKDLLSQLSLSYRKLSRAALSLGWRRLEAVNVRPEGDVELKIVDRHYMGLELPHLSLTPISSKPHYSPAGTNSLLDEAQAAFVKFLPLLVAYAEREAHLFSLSQALKKTMKRVNALENLFIPDYKDTLLYVRETLEELEREEMYIRKLVKDSGR